MALKQVFIINSDLKMGKGKIAVQTAHGEVNYMARFLSDYMEREIFDETKNEVNKTNMLEQYFDWVKDGLMKKVVLKATQEEMLILIGIIELVNECRTKDDIWFDIVFDKGLTQVPADSMTCIVFEPLGEQMADHHFKHYKLL